MDKKEIEHRIKKYELVRECAEENLNELNIQLRDLRETEKPLKFSKRTRGGGDFEISEREFYISKEPGIEFRIEGKTATATLSEAVEIRNGLSNMITDLKRKENKNE